jgi:hypothetical protein
LRASAPGLCAAFRHVIESRESTEQDTRYFLLTSMAEHERLVAPHGTAYDLYRFGFDDEASRLDYLDHACNPTSD